ncbi:hypothetical protein [Pseudotamlana carrageenivorans]|uniref:Uncharacterized protein n=1 Tax=Pseudotamlana carrageenivorans TaxID=2069432 RepID=A0A2I7SES3_9FLAO|nr:hypothetical protein [Tamlana carrageenivorans]AUS04401.1 hypothetical protein C1A40_02445 [Tamlana carrageenivorans]
MGLIEITTNLETANAIEDHINRELRTGVNRSYQINHISRQENYCVVYLEPSHNYKEIDPSDLFFLGFYTCLNC